MPTGFPHPVISATLAELGIRTSLERGRSTRMAIHKGKESVVKS